MQKQTSAKLVVQTERVTKTLTVFSLILQEICQGGVVTLEALLTAEAFNLTFKDGYDHLTHSAEKLP